MRYKYFYKGNPKECPICGRGFLLDVEYAESGSGVENVNGRLVWHCSDEDAYLLNAKVCYGCGQPVFYRFCDIDDSDCFYLYLDASIGWQGSAPTICIAVNQTTGETNSSVFASDGYKNIELDKEFMQWLKDNIQSLLDYSSNEKEEHYYDDHTYYFQVFADGRKNRFSFQHSYLDKHPLWRKLVDLILKTNKEMR